MADIEREEMIEQAHKLYDDSRNLLSELRWQRTYFCRGSNIISKQEKLFNIWIFDECLKRLEERKQGTWVKVEETDLGTLFKCSECGRTVLTESIGHKKLSDYPYCHCGAEMRGSENG